MRIKGILKVVCVFLIVIIMTNIGIICKNKLTYTKEKENNIGKAENEIQKLVIDSENVLTEDTLSSVENINENEMLDTVTTNNIEEPKKVEKVSSIKQESQDITPKMEVEPEIKVNQEVTITKPVIENSTPSNNDNSQNNDNIPPVANQTLTEEYRYNASMTQTIVDIINNNPSSYMLQDGYSVEIDSSITTLTNQFTFSEQRVINKIAFKAGTIRVYAQDYYYNGELLFTECYIF